MESTESINAAISQQPSHAFDIFLSYSSRDEVFAAKLEKALESYRFPKSLKDVKRTVNVFRDKSDVEAGENYDRIIEQHVKDSAKLIVVCSPDARTSTFVEDEVRLFIENHREQDIIPVLLRGKANNEATDENEKAFPEILCENRMPLAANFLGWDTHKGKLHKGPFSSSFYSILAAIHGIDRRKLEQIDEKIRARRRALIFSVASLIIATLSVALVFAVISQRKAVAATNEATRSARAETEAKDKALASAKAETEAKDKALASAKAEAEAKDKALASAKAEKTAKNEAVAAAKAEEKAKNEAIAQKEMAEQRLYVADMNLAQRAHESGQMTRVNEILNAQRPTSVPQLRNDRRSFYWYYLWRNSYKDRNTIAAHDGIINASIFSPNGKILASASDDTTVKLWDVADGHLSGTFKGHTGAVRSIVFLGSGNTAASAGDDMQVRIWDADTQKEVRSLPHGLKVLSLAFSLEKNLLAAGNRDGSVTVWDLSTDRELITISGSVGEKVHSVAFSDNGKILAAGTGRFLKLWDTITFKELAKFQEGRGDLLSVSFRSNNLIASGGSDGMIRFWDVDGKKQLQQVRADLIAVYSVTFSPDGRTMASAADDPTVKLWDAETLHELATYKTHQNSVRSVAFSPDGNLLASASRDKTLRLLDISARQQLTAIEGYHGITRSIVFAPHGQTFAVGLPSAILLWNLNELRSGEQTPKYLDNSTVMSIAFSQNGKLIAAVGGGGTLQLWNAESLEELDLRTQIRSARTADPVNLTSVTFSPDSNLLATAGLESLVHLWSVNPFEDLGVLTTQSNVINSVAFSPLNRTLAAACEDNTIVVWNLNTPARKEIAVLRDHSAPVYKIAFSREGRLMASASFDTTVKLWDTMTWKLLATLRGHSDRVFSVAFSADGRTLASASRDRTLRLWDTSTYKELASLAQEDPVTSVAFSPDGNTLVSGSTSGAIKLWFAATKVQVDTSRHY